MDLFHVDQLAKVIWDYHHLNHKLRKADCIFVLGSHDVRVAEYAADLFLKDCAPWIVFSGGQGRLTKGLFEKPEAEVFAEIAVRRGVPPQSILIENRSTNTGENVEFTRRLLEERGLDFHSFILVQKPYMERRTYATFRKVWPAKEFIVTSPPIPYAAYCNEEFPKDQVINIMVGDLQRIRIYPERGFQIPQPIPENVWRAYEELVAMGYDRHLIETATLDQPSGNRKGG